MYILYGIPNCDSVKKARVWLDSNNVSYEFHDYKKSGISRQRLKAWCSQIGWENLMNKKSTTWRDLDESVQQTVTNTSKAVDIMAEYTSVIKRPVIEQNDKIVVLRFDAEEYRRIFL